jgi:hypothetical protein
MHHVNEMVLTFFPPTFGRRTVIAPFLYPAPAFHKASPCAAKPVSNIFSSLLKESSVITLLLRF